MNEKYYHLIKMQMTRIISTEPAYGDKCLAMSNIDIV